MYEAAAICSSFKSGIIGFKMYSLKMKWRARMLSPGSLSIFRLHEDKTSCCYFGKAFGAQGLEWHLDPNEKKKAANVDGNRNKINQAP